MSNKHNDKIKETLYEEIDEHLNELETRIRYYMKHFNCEDDKEFRKVLIDELHDLQALLYSPEVQKDIEEQEKQDPSEGSPFHPKYIKPEDR